MLKPLKKFIKTAVRAVRGPRVSRQKLVRDFQSLGIRAGDLLLVHASLSAIGFVPGREKTVIAALKEVLGPQGTLVLPTHTWEWVNAGSRSFDARTAPSCVGRLPEIFRTMPGVKRSLHPTHSVAAIGPQADMLLVGHEDAATPCGEGTPYHRLLQNGGRILMLGAGLESNTSFHTLEAIAGFPHLMEPYAFDFQITDLNGLQIQRTCALHLEGIHRCYPEMEELLVSGKVIARGKAGAAKTLLIEGKPFLETMTALLANNPNLLMVQPDQAIPSPRAR